MNRPNLEAYKYIDLATYVDDLEKYCDELEKNIEKYRWHDLRKNPYDVPNSVLDKDDRWNYNYISCNSSGGIRCRYLKTEPHCDSDYIFEVLESEDTVAWREIEPFEVNEDE